MLLPIRCNKTDYLYNQVKYLSLAEFLIKMVIRLLPLAKNFIQLKSIKKTLQILIFIIKKIIYNKNKKIIKLLIKIVMKIYELYFFFII